MPLSPKDVEQRTFTASFRGYAEDEVDAFLEEVIASIETYQQIIRERDARIAELEASHLLGPITSRDIDEDLADDIAHPDDADDIDAVDDDFAPVQAPTPEIVQAPPPVAVVSSAQVDESVVSRALIVAQRTADQLVEEANLEADQIIERARRRAAELEEADVEHRRSLVVGYQQLRGELAGLRTRFSESFGTAESTFASLESEIDGFLAGQRIDAPRHDAPRQPQAPAPAPVEDEPEDATDRRPWER